MSVLNPDRKKFTIGDFDRMGELGILQDLRVELINGEIVNMSPVNNPHVAAIGRAFWVLNGALGARYWVRMCGDFICSEATMLQPDLAVVPLELMNRSDKPRDAFLVMEISESTLRFDRTEKAAFYAAAGVQDYWILNLEDWQLEVYRKLERNAAGSFGYAQTEPLAADQSVSPLVALELKFSIADMLPPLPQPK